MKTILLQLLKWFLPEQKYLQEAKCLLTFRKSGKLSENLTVVPVHQSSSTILLPVCFGRNGKSWGDLERRLWARCEQNMEDVVVSEYDQTSAEGSTSCEKTETRRVEANVQLSSYFLPCVGAPHAIFTFSESSHTVESSINQCCKESHLSKKWRCRVEIWL